MSDDSLDLTAGLPADLLAAVTEAMALAEPERARVFAAMREAVVPPMLVNRPAA